MGQPYGAPQQQTNGKAIAALVLGIASIVLACYGIGLLPGIPAIILGRMSGREIEEGNGTGDGLAKAGLITGIIGVVLSVFGLLYLILVIVAGVTDS